MQKRFLNLHEYQSKELMANHQINTQRFQVVTLVEQVPDALQRLNASEYVIKAQILAGGRGKGTFSSGLKGGVQLTKNTQEAASLISRMLGYSLVTEQTDRQGVPVHRVMIAEAKDLARETYLAILLDRASGGPILVGSPRGGVNIEEVAASDPSLIYSEPILNFEEGPSDEQLRKFCPKLGFTEGTLEQAIQQIKRLYALFQSVDATQIEVNPFGVTPEGEVLCFDAKISFDDNAEFRQRSIFSQADHLLEDPREVAAKSHALNYIGMEGDIGCLVNGAGLAMATMDIIKLYGGSPANFLDVGGSANTSQILAALRLLMSDAAVKTVLINIFGGIMRCDVIAGGIIAAFHEGIITKPVIVRLVGTNSELAMEMIRREMGDDMISVCPKLDQAAKAAVSSSSKKAIKVNRLHSESE